MSRPNSAAKAGRLADRKGAKPADRSNQGKPSASDPPTIQFAPPLKPQRKLYIISWIVFVLWVAFLLILYFKTVYPLRHGPQSVQPSATGQPAKSPAMSPERDLPGQ